MRPKTSYQGKNRIMIANIERRRASRQRPAK
jgi:hypothetical protein